MRVREWTRSVVGAGSVLLTALVIFQWASGLAAAQSQLPDLTIQGLRANDQCRVVVTLRNDGPGPVPAWAITEFPTVGFWFDGVNKGQWRLDSQTMYALQSPGAMAAVTTDLILSSSASVLAIVDYAQKLAEKREDNNRFTQTVTCAAAPSQGGAVLQRPPAASQIPKATQGLHMPHPQGPLTPQGR